MRILSLLHHLRKGWWVLLASVLVCVGAAAAVNAVSTPIYQSSVKFYVFAPPATGQSALQADELVRLRIVNYASLLTSERVVEQVAKASGVSASVDEVTQMISAFGDAETLILTVNVQGPRQEDAVAVASAIASNFNRMVNELESAENQSGTETILNLVGGPTDEPTPVSPRQNLNLGIGLLVGLAIGTALLVARHRSDKSFRSPTAFEAETSQRLLATVPYEPEHLNEPKALSPWLGPLRLESARNLRTALQFRPDADTSKVLSVTSADAREGRTTLAVNLALSYALAGHRTVLVEADLRSPRLAKDAGLESAEGLAEVLQGRRQVDDVLSPVGHDMLWVLPGGMPPAHPSELLSSQAAEALLARLRATHDVVIIDAPPVLPFVDARIVAAVSDGVLLVVQHGATTPERFSAALESLGLVGARIVGAVFCGLPVGRRERKARPETSLDLPPAPPAPPAPPVDKSKPARARNGLSSAHLRVER